MKEGGIIIPDSAVMKQQLNFKKGDSLVIVAKGDSAPDGLAIARDKNCECWGLNDIKRSPELTMLFELHEWDDRCKKYNSDLPDLKIPVMMQKVEPDVPTSIKFPMEQLMEQFGIAYYNNQICQMIAFAIQTKRFNNLYLFGVDYGSTDRVEQEFERPCTEFWIGQAIARGINVFVSQQSNLMTYCGYIKGVVYGYSKNYQVPFDQFRDAQPAFWAEYILGHYGGRALTKEVYSHEDWVSELGKFCTQYVHGKLVELKALEDARDEASVAEDDAKAPKA